MSPDAKKSTTWESFYVGLIKGSTNTFMKAKLMEREAFYEEMFNSSNTWPEFIVRLKNSIPKADRCKFFNTWLEAFLHRYVPDFRRDWVIVVY